MLVVSSSLKVELCVGEHFAHSTRT
jgi:hypothetical protein